MAISIDRKISESATTTVYRAFDDVLGRQVLLKVLHRHLAHDEQLRERFTREARACASLRSEHIVQVHDLRDHEGAPAIVMEYVEGRSLKEVIMEEGSCSPAFTEKVAVQVLRGLAAAHAHGIIHRDIKPGNILVSTTGTIKITDFGLAQFSLAPTLTAEGTIVGTPAYLAPEMLRGEAADVRTDLFSLGTTLAEALSGKQLFEGATYSECLNRISRFTIEQLDTLAPLSPPEFVAFVKKLMHPDRRQRYASPEEALEALGKRGASEYALPQVQKERGRRGLGIGAAVALAMFVAAAYLVMNGTADVPPGQPMSSPLSRSDSVVHHVAPADSQRTVVESVSAREEELPVTRQGPPVRSEILTPSLDSGRVTLVSTPGAKVHVDSLFAGEFPLHGPLRLSAGLHSIVVTHPFFTPIVRPVRILPGDNLTIEADFQEQAAYLRCTSDPWAEISVDGQYRETTPLDRPIILSAGKRRIRFYNPAFGDSAWDVTLSPRETLRVSVTFRP